MALEFDLAARDRPRDALTATLERPGAADLRVVLEETRRASTPADVPVPCVAATR